MDDTFLMDDGRIVELRSDCADDWEVWTTGDTPEKVGEFNFFYFDMPDGHGVKDCYLVTNMDIGDDAAGNSYKYNGIGEEIIRRMSVDFPIYFARDDGHSRDDGAHLTGDGVGFAEKMVARGLAEWN